MDKKILKIAVKKFEKLKSRYKGFINVGVDNWRGYRFIFDTKDVRCCQNNCFKCPLYILLKNEEEGLFSTGLYPANEKDKGLFGTQNFLNCKTLEGYQGCYINFLVKEAKTIKEIKDELELIKNFNIIFSNENKDLNFLEDDFRKKIFRETLKRVGKRKSKIIRTLWYTK